MFYFLRILILFLGLFRFSQPALAANFSSEMSTLSNLCTYSNCRQPYRIETVYDHLQSDVATPIEKRLKSAAIEQAQIWADTILEGDYYTDSRTRLDKAAALYMDGRLVAYFITYSEKAWDTSNCSFDGLNDSTLADCKPGRIVESVYLSPDFSDYYFTEENYARFMVQGTLPL